MIYTVNIMKLQKITTVQPAVDYLASVLRQHLDAGEKVCWLVPGGSAIALATLVAEKLIGSDLSKLTVTLTDERFGPVGHSDSNWLQLHAAGFHLPGATMVPILHGHDIEATTRELGDHLKLYCDQADYSLGLFGIGPDGHTAGILPGSPAVSATQSSATFRGPDYPRITITPSGIARLDEVVVYAMGSGKLVPLQNLQTDLPVSEQPAQALKQVAKLTIFNDQIGDTE